MAYDKKRTDRMSIPGQVNMDPELGSEIRAGAARDDRPIGLHIVVLLKEAVIARRRRAVHERRSSGAQPRSGLLRDAQFGAPPRMATHDAERRKETA